ncbi:YuzF family protein [Anoxybacillus salavatliensis]|uniref:YuzF family protein n=1 Tax=Anoxybacillus TaxID=150247 RepID=UPI0009465713|nr:MULTISPECIES: YuzF family protein [Anoxybacillus]MCQ5365937.1 YuzF family protein [Anoxybacillus gonensis]
MTPQFMSFIDPYVYQTLQTIRGKEVIIETVRGNVQGIIQDVKPDHIVLKSSDTLFFVRIQQIVWIMPK